MFKLTYFEGNDTIIINTSNHKEIVSIINKLRANNQWYILKSL